jgi:hypothetical protein
VMASFFVISMVWVFSPLCSVSVISTVCEWWPFCHTY